MPEPGMQNLRLTHLGVQAGCVLVWIIPRQQSPRHGAGFGVGVPVPRRKMSTGRTGSLCPGWTSVNGDSIIITALVLSYLVKILLSSHVTAFSGCPYPAQIGAFISVSPALSVFVSWSAKSRAGREKPEVSRKQLRRIRNNAGGMQMEIDGIKVWEARTHEVLRFARMLSDSSHCLCYRLPSFLRVSKISYCRFMCSKERNVVKMASRRCPITKLLNTGSESV